MRILVTNDDGINAPGLKIAKEIATDLAGENGKVVVVAPAYEQSGVAHSVSFTRPCLLERIKEDEFSLEGTPADCVLAGLDYLMEEAKPDLVISGINRGRNIAGDVLYSGTVGAAMEGALNGIKSIALSQCYSKETLKSSDLFSAARSHGKKICRIFAKNRITEYKDSCLFYNVNFPACQSESISGVKVCPTDFKREKTFLMSRQISPNGKDFLWVKHNSKERVHNCGLDSYYLSMNYVTVSSLRTDMNWLKRNEDLELLFGDG